nr:isoprenylcysteine carboxylmethyltransferase family protein [Candidatus Njordarchaeum guaymaensis]
MLGRFEILFGMVGAYIFASVVLLLGRQRRGKRLPPGSIPVEGPPLRKESSPPATPWSRVTVSIGLELGALFGVIAIGLSVFDYWNAVPSCLVLDLPLLLNWAGLIGFWVVCIWGDFVMLYNVNYTPVTRGIKDRYVLATGGPYRFVRHPMYLAKALQTIFVFLITGIWLSLVGAVFWVELPRQAAREEELMLKTFGKKYEKYCKVTGRFLPKRGGSPSGKRL